MHEDESWVPVEVVYLPVVHDIQEAAPEAVENFPPGQLMHELEPLAG